MAVDKPSAPSFSAPNPPDGPGVNGLPDAFVVLDAAADKAHDDTSALAAAELLLLVVAAAAGVASWRVGRHHLDLPAAAGAVAFAAAIAVAYLRRTTAVQQRWVQARAAAESVKSAAWAYAAGGDPLSRHHPAADAALLDHIMAALAEAPSPLPSPDRRATQITDWMRATRMARTSHRRAVYSAYRLDDQTSFYSDGADRHSRSAGCWSAVTIAANLVGIAAGVARFLDYVHVDLVGVAAAIGGGAVAWGQLHQHRTLAAAYSGVARQLCIARDRLASTSDADWPDFVRGAEELMARERTVWLLERGSHRR